jgi:hypothetical protein
MYSPGSEEKSSQTGNRFCLTGALMSGVNVATKTAPKVKVTQP